MSDARADGQSGRTTPSDALIVGCQRSGTTLLRLVLASHPDVQAFDEFTSYQTLCRRRAWTRERSVAAFKIPRWTEQLDAPQLSDYGHEVACESIYCGQRIVFAIRDVRDVVASMLALGDERSWLDDWGIPILRAKFAREPELSQRWRAEIAMCEAAPDSRLGYAALYWSIKTHAMVRYRRAGWPVFPIVYERLVSDLEDELRALCDFLAIGFDDAMLRHHMRQHAEVASDGRTVGNTDPRRPVDASSVGRWRGVLRATDVATIEAVARTTVEAIAVVLDTSQRSSNGPERNGC